MIEKSDEQLIVELAQTHTIRQLADKWEVTYKQMSNYLYRRGVKAQSFSRPVKKPTSAQKQKLMDRIESLALAGTPGKVIAMKINRKPDYVSKVLSDLRISATAQKRRITLNQYRAAKIIAARMEMPVNAICLFEYGWTKYKTSYAAKLYKKAAE